MVQMNRKWNGFVKEETCTLHLQDLSSGLEFTKRVPGLCVGSVVYMVAHIDPGNKSGTWSDCIELVYNLSEEEIEKWILMYLLDGGNPPVTL